MAAQKTFFRMAAWLGRVRYGPTAEVAKLPSGAWLLRDAAKVLELAEEAVDEVLRRD